MTPKCAAAYDRDDASALCDGIVYNGTSSGHCQIVVYPVSD